jgi:hypothetical protein
VLNQTERKLRVLPAAFGQQCVRHSGVRTAVSTSPQTARAPNAMHVAFNVFGHVEVDDVGYPWWVAWMDGWMFDENGP